MIIILNILNYYLKNKNNIYGLSIYFLILKNKLKYKLI